MLDSATLKGKCHEIFRLRFFFNQTTFPGPNRLVQKRFRIFLNIRGVIRIRNLIQRGVDFLVYMEQTPEQIYKRKFW